MNRTRRVFLQSVGVLGTVLSAAPADPFDALPAEVWRNARWNGLIMIHRPVPPNIGVHARLTKPGEPGEQLRVTGQAFAPDGRTPAPGVTVYAYNTDAEGYYGEGRKEYPPRIYGWMKTDAAGRFDFLTVKPGRYPSMREPAHVHFSIWGGGYPPHSVETLRFEGDSYLTASMLEKDRAGKDFASIQPLVRDRDGAWACSIRIRLKTETTFGIS